MRLPQLHSSRGAGDRRAAQWAVPMTPAPEGKTVLVEVMRARRSHDHPGAMKLLLADCAFHDFAIVVVSQLFRISRHPWQLVDCSLAAGIRLRIHSTQSPGNLRPAKSKGDYAKWEKYDLHLNVKSHRVIQ
mmetsp:Transcript_51214/g.93688  ORF Transcript_51214/g.93688 Transcript_51214/m.93688 type:complete len:131 (+) Transcript_51214:27-419(+)